VAQSERWRSVADWGMAFLCVAAIASSAAAFAGFRALRIQQQDRWILREEMRRLREEGGQLASRFADAQVRANDLAEASIKAQAMLARSYVEAALFSSVLQMSSRHRDDAIEQAGPLYPQPSGKIQYPVGTLAVASLAKFRDDLDLWAREAVPPTRSGDDDV
jgi:hypothetical protein